MTVARLLALIVTPALALIAAGCGTSSTSEVGRVQTEDTVRSPSASPAESKKCDVTSADKTAMQELSAALAEATPALVALDRGEDGDLAAAARAAVVMASTSRVAEERASNAALREALSDYTSGWKTMAEYLNNLAVGLDSDRDLFESGRSVWVRGQDKFRSFIVDCDVKRSDFS